MCTSVPSFGSVFAFPAGDHPRAHRTQRPPPVLLHPAALEPDAGLPGGLGPTHRPQDEGRDQAGVNAEALLPGGDGRRPLQAGRDGNSHQIVLGLLEVEEHMWKASA